MAHAHPDGRSVEAANAIVAEVFAPWVQDLVLTVEACGTDGVTMRMAFDDKLCRIGGTVCGQALMSLADTCMVIVVSTALGEFREMATTNQNTSFFRAVVGRDVIARGRILKPGRLLMFGEVTLYADGDERPAAHVTSTYALPPKG